VGKGARRAQNDAVLAELGYGAAEIAEITCAIRD
jgi:hypothetical protein